ncbi:hypothetical protein [Pseudoalteromonas sp. 5-MNA-CIBAN-0065]|uniref:hypothetical protein n=2 Tax=unclassified Pseudoalteromonas TaxID=194690 RepID=UPI00332F786B|tara:strand:+ start:138 stop:1244 length:1107 start_codon:yes stop_codon:yes gene_type:complete
MDIWLERLDKFLTIIRPKAYNVIARTIVGLGVVLVAESQLNIVQALVIAGYESLFGYSEILRDFMKGSSNPWVGLFLIVIGLIYHYLMTVGKEHIDLRMSEIPKTPVLGLELLNSDLEQYKDNSVSLRGYIVDPPSEDEIPEYKVNYNLPNMEGLSNVLNTFGNIERNPSFYKERGEFLKIWGGSELISLKITNLTPVLATGVKVEMTLPRLKGISADNTKDDFPSLPSEKVKNQFGSLSALSIPHRTVHYDIKRDHNNQEYYFVWNVNDIQANTSCISDAYVFLRSEESFDIELKIYCDQFENPVRETYRVNRNSQSLVVSVSQLMAEDEAFNELVNSCVMDGYIRRVAERKLEEYEHENKALIPRG